VFEILQIVSKGYES